MDVRHLSVFVAVAQEMSFTRAADGCCAVGGVDHGAGAGASSAWSCSTVRIGRSD
jgi:hypothetical protein